MRLNRSLVVGASCALGFAAVMGSATPAFADYAPEPADIVGVGSDTVQNVMNFVADGYTNGDQGINQGGNVNRVVSFNATPDENDRAGFLPASQGGGNLNPTIILRNGTNPVQRPNGSGGGVAALIADYANTGTNEQINFTRSSSIGGLVGAAGTAKPLHVARLATDDIVIAVNQASTNAPATISGTDLVAIYSCTKTDWSSVAGGTAGTIVPLYPQPGSGTGKTFLADLAIIAGTSTFTPGSCATVAEENDPAAITGQSAANKANAIAPFSSGRIDLYNASYFHNPGDAFPTPNAITPGIKLLYGTGQTADACTAPAKNQAIPYCRTRGLYVAWRQSDDTLNTQWQPGIAKNWVQALFAKTNGSTATPFVNSNGGKALITDAGVTPAYSDCGVTTGSAFTSSCTS